MLWEVIKNFRECKAQHLDFEKEEDQKHRGWTTYATPVEQMHIGQNSRAYRRQSQIETTCSLCGQVSEGRRLKARQGNKNDAMIDDDNELLRKTEKTYCEYPT